MHQDVIDCGLHTETLCTSDDVCRYAADMIAVAVGVSRVNIDLLVCDVAKAISCVTEDHNPVVAHALLLAKLPVQVVGPALLPKVHHWIFTILGCLEDIVLHHRRTLRARHHQPTPRPHTVFTPTTTRTGARWTAAMQQETSSLNIWRWCGSLV